MNGRTSTPEPPLRSQQRSLPRPQQRWDVRRQRRPSASRRRNLTVVRPTLDVVSFAVNQLVTAHRRLAGCVLPHQPIHREIVMAHPAVMTVAVSVARALNRALADILTLLKKRR